MEMAARKQGKTNFAVTCSLLSRYIKEKGSIAELGIGMGQRSEYAAKGKSQAFRPPPTTMNLLPGADVSSVEDGEEEEDVSSAGSAMELFPQRAGFVPSLAAVAEDASEQERNQLTIFYGGKVMVFDNFPAKKAKELLQLASKGSSTAQKPNHLSRTVQRNLSYLPIARKASLQRFFEKRKDRISARAPYHVAASPETVNPVKQEKSGSWLGLGPQFSFPSLSLSSEHTR
ncbi:hypothetical protein OPV22_026785 [Ensete ventricosum]|uniref:Protein TIFY n=1 Tax=Ensete ventricosum TaxID=4639 RepID=A0AAV8Q225_ENSVE|nr:hypothetical protein OPV22_026785 [Ensete ventricosum]